MTEAVATKASIPGAPCSPGNAPAEEIGTKTGSVSNGKGESGRPAHNKRPQGIPPRAGSSDNSSSTPVGSFTFTPKAAAASPGLAPASPLQSAPAAAPAPAPAPAVAPSAASPAPAAAPAPALTAATASLAPPQAAAPPPTPAPPVKAAGQALGAVYKEIEGIKEALTDIRKQLIREAGFGDIKRGAENFKIDEAGYWAAELEFTQKTEAAVALLTEHKTANSEGLLNQELAQLKVHDTAFNKLQQLDPKVYNDSKIFSDVYYGMVDMITAAMPITPGNADKFVGPWKELSGVMAEHVVAVQKTNSAAAQKDPSQAALYVADVRIQGALAGARHMLTSNTLTPAIQGEMQEKLCEKIDELAAQWSALTKISDAAEQDQRHRDIAGEIKTLMKKAVEAAQARKNAVDTKKEIQSAAALPTAPAAPQAGPQAASQAAAPPAAAPPAAPQAAPQAASQADPALSASDEASDKSEVDTDAENDIVTPKPHDATAHLDSDPSLLGESTVPLTDRARDRLCELISDDDSIGRAAAAA